jgi:hypothetical protein
LRKEKDGMMWSKHQQMTERKIVQVIRSDAIGHEAKEIGRSNNNSSRRELKQGWLADQESKTGLGTSTCGKLWSLNRNRNNNKLV